MGAPIVEALTRSSFLRRGGAVLAAGWLTGALAGPASALDAPDGDVAALRLLIGAELLALDFQSRALASGKAGSEAKGLLQRLHADEQAHYDGLADLMGQAGETPAAPDDIDFAYPRSTFASEAAILRLAEELEELQLGAYVGANATVETPRLRLALGQISANEAQHVSALRALAGKPAVGKAFGPALRSDAVTSVLDLYES
jgi:rubrerythrin